MNVKLLLGALLLAAVGTGCVGTRVEFADVPLERLDLTRGRKVMGRASGLSLFELIPIGVNDRQIRAYEELKAEAGSDYLTDIRIKDSWAYVVIGLKYGTTITATAYPEKGASGAGAAPAAQTFTQKLEELKGLREKGLLTEPEYEAARKKMIGN